MVSVKFIKRTMQGCFWLSLVFFCLPIFLFEIYDYSHANQSKSQNPRTFYQALQSYQDATRTINKQKAYSVINTPEMNSILVHYQQSLEKALKVDRNSLDSEFPELGTRFHDCFMKGLQSNIKALKGNDVESSISAQKLLSEWDDWYIARLSAIRDVLVGHPKASSLYFVIAGVFLLIWGVLKVFLAGNILFWLKVRDHPDVAYDWFAKNQAWAVIHNDSENSERYYPKKDWAGPFLLCVPKLNWQMVKILGKADSFEKAEKEFIKLIQAIEN